MGDLMGVRALLGDDVAPVAAAWCYSGDDGGSSDDYDTSASGRCDAAWSGNVGTTRQHGTRVLVMWV